MKLQDGLNLDYGTNVNWATSSTCVKIEIYYNWWGDVIK